MGNVNDKLTGKEYEYKNGKKLIISITADSKDSTALAIESARKECVKPHGSDASVMDFDLMIDTMLEYLTREYSCDDPPKQMSPLDYANSLGHHESAGVISSNINTLQRSVTARERNTETTKESLKKKSMLYDYFKGGHAPPPEKRTEEEKEPERIVPSKDRAMEAKARLVAFNQQRKDKQGGK
jgi:hypothetical protein